MNEEELSALEVHEIESLLAREESMALSITRCFDLAAKISIIMCCTSNNRFPMQYLLHHALRQSICNRCSASETVSRVVAMFVSGRDHPATNILGRGVTLHFRHGNRAAPASEHMVNKLPEIRVRDL